jgi:hypothetical protein
MFATGEARSGTSHAAPAFSPRGSEEHAMAFDPGKNPFNPLLIAAIAVVLALVAFLVFRDSSGSQQHAGISTAPPPATTQTPSTLPPPGPPRTTQR